MRPAGTPNPLPLELAEGVHWIGRCNALATINGKSLHSYNSAYLIVGDQSSAVVDTGMPGQVAFAEQLDALMAQHAAPPLRYFLSTHAEIAHIGGLADLMRRFPDLIAIGDVSDLHLVWPELEDRFQFAAPGERFDLGGTEIVVTESVFRDLPWSRWFFDTRSATLFTADGFAVAHYHQDGACGRFAEDVHDLDVEGGLPQFAEAAFPWTRFVDIEPYAARLEELVVAELGAKFIAPAHGLPLRDPRRTLPRVRIGLKRMEDAGDSSAALQAMFHN